MCKEHEKTNPVLKFVMKSIYEKRNPLPMSPLSVVRTETVNDKAFCEIWFMTEGCSHDKNGGCTMCNYGKGHCVNSEDILAELSEQICHLPDEIHELILTPTGSMLDDCEVSSAFRKQVFSLLEGKHFNKFTIETRADTVTEEKLSDLKNSVYAKTITIEIGVECTDEWILRNCINKELVCADLKKAVKQIHDIGFKACANIGVGIPFLNEKRNIDLTVASIKQSIGMGFDEIVLFPYHVKHGTLLEWLYLQNMYHCCSLWSIPEVLSQLTREECDITTISWYKNYYTDKKKIISSPDVCEKCKDLLLLKLDNYKNHPGSEALLELLEINCDCRNEWKTALTNKSSDIQFDTIESFYRLLGDRFTVDRELLENELVYMKKSLRRSVC